MKVITLIASLVLSSVSAQANLREMSCINPATRASFGIAWNADDLKGWVLFNSILSQKLQNQGVEFPDGSYAGKVNWNNGFGFFAHQSLRDVSVELKSENGGLWLIYRDSKKQRTATFYFNPGECRQ